MKKCNKCLEEKPTDAFSVDNDKHDGLSSQCKLCRNNHAAEYGKKNKDKIRHNRLVSYHANRDQELLKQKERRSQRGSIWNANRRDKRKSEPLPFLIKEARSRARRKNLDFDITEQDISIPEKCPVLNIPLFVSEGRPSGNSPTIDRIDNSMGYTKNNVIVVSYRANSIKSDSTLEELKRIVAFYSSLELI